MQIEFLAVAVGVMCGLGVTLPARVAGLVQIWPLSTGAYNIGC
jgi:hypothetical protein